MLVKEPSLGGPGRAGRQGQDEGDDGAMKRVNRAMGGTSIKAPYGQDLLLHPPGQGQWHATF